MYRCSSILTSLLLKDWQSQEKKTPLKKLKKKKNPKPKERLSDENC